MLGEEEDSAPLPLLGGDEEDESEPLPMMMDAFDESVPEAPAFDAAAFGESDKDERDSTAGSEAELPPLDFAISLEPTPPPPAPPPSAPTRQAAMEEARPKPTPPLAPRPAAPVQTPGAAPFKGVSEPDQMGHEMLATRGDFAGAIASLRKLTSLHHEAVALAQRLVEYATRMSDPATLVAALLDLGDTLRRTGQAAQAQPVYQKVLGIEPKNLRAMAALGKASAAAPAPKASPAEGFVDLGSMLLGDDEDDTTEKSTRFVVAYEEPTEDEQADFAKMLSQFKAKVAENLSADDVKAHQDLGTAYKEMGLIDEAIGEFQQALRASPEHLPTYGSWASASWRRGSPRRRCARSSAHSRRPARSRTSSSASTTTWGARTSSSGTRKTRWSSTTTCSHWISTSRMSPSVSGRCGRLFPSARQWLRPTSP
ncbi:MAG: hypothetical protein EXR95_06435 [Gemmatimonadetes bacterium]|nr:hypothetical protein [Gemmatimonadota bacterium]